MHGSGAGVSRITVERTRTVRNGFDPADSACGDEQDHAGRTDAEQQCRKCG